MHMRVPRDEWQCAAPRRDMPLGMGLPHCAMPMMLSIVSLSSHCCIRGAREEQPHYITLIYWCVVVDGTTGCATYEAMGRLWSIMRPHIGCCT